MMALLLGGATAAAADVLVVRATGPSAKNFPAGKSLPDNGRITLQANDSVVVLDSRGTRTLRGPGTFSPGAAAQASARPSMLAGVDAPQRRARIGAVRSVGAGLPRSPSIWHVDVAKSSNICVADPGNVVLWRADASKPLALTVARPDGRQAQQLNWAAGQTTIAWPTGLTVTDGADYRLSAAGQPATSLKFRTLPARPTGLEDMASSLIRNGCEAQLDLLIETVRLPDGVETEG